MSPRSAASPGFPSVDRALTDPNGLLAAGGDLNTEWLLEAYSRGIFPWFDDDDGPLLWWSPDPRAVLVPQALKISRSLARSLRNGDFTVTFDRAFADVIHACAEIRKSAPVAGHGPFDDGAGTWITQNMETAYNELHQIGYAHSVEVWNNDGALVGGLYGVSLGRMFFGESMFSAATDASKVALSHLARQLALWDFSLIDCQVSNPHLTSLGSVDIPRSEFMAFIEANAHLPTLHGPWRLSHFPPSSWQRQNSSSS